MSVSRVFTGQLQPNLYSLSELIGDAVAFYIVTPDDVVETQIDVFIQIEITPTENRQMLLFGNRTETDTTLLVPIPKEYVGTETNKRFALYCEFTVSLEVWCLYIDKDINTELIEDIYSELLTIRDRQLIDLAEDAAIVANQISQNTAIAMLGVALSPITAGASLAVEPVLLSGTSALTQLLLLP